MKEPTVQAAILGGSRYHGGWDEQSDLDIIVILADSGDGEETERAARLALAELKERYYPGYRDRSHPDHEVKHGHIVVSMEYFLGHRHTLNDPMSQASRQGRIFTKEPGAEKKYRHDGDTSNEWELVTLGKLQRAARENQGIPGIKRFFDRPRTSRLDVRSVQGGKEQPGSRHRVWVLMNDGDLSDASPDRLGNQSHDAHDRSEWSDDKADSSDTSYDSSDESLIVELVALRERTRSAEDLAEYRGELLKEAESRYHTPLQKLSSAHRTVETLSRVLPAPAEPTRSQPAAAMVVALWEGTPVNLPSNLVDANRHECLTRDMGLATSPALGHVHRAVCR